MSETSEVTGPALKLLKKAGYVAWRQNSGGRRGRVTLAPAGTPDILGYLSPRGRLFAIETKLGNKQLSKAQEEWSARAGGAGVLVAVCNSVAEVLEQVALWQVAEGHHGT